MTTELKQTRKKKEQPPTCKAKNCQELHMVNCNYCEKHWFPAAKPENEVFIPRFVNAQFKYYADKDAERAKDGYIHISSLNLCIREKVYQHLDRRPLTPIKIKWFSTGNAVHHKLQVLAQQDPDIKIEMPVVMGKIIAHIDMYDTNLKIPCEAKSLVQPEVEVPKNFHIDQLKMYMAMTGDQFGVCLYDPLMAYKIPFSEWHVTMTKQELQAKREEIEAKAALYAKAMELKDPYLAPHIGWDSEYNWHCEKCDYATECEVLRTRQRNEEAANKSQGI